MSRRIFGGIGAALQMKPYRTARSNTITGGYNRAAYCAAASPGEGARELKMDQEKEKRPVAEQDESKAHVDVMTHSFGEGYSTRCDEEGFGGIYGRDDLVIKTSKGKHVNHPEYDDSQGCEVKEKERARNQKHGDNTA